MRQGVERRPYPNPDKRDSQPVGASRHARERALEWLRALGESLQAPEKSKEKADVRHAIYDRITVAGPEIVGVRLTQAAYAHGLALALPDKVEMARPTGFEPGDTTIIVRVPIAPRPW